MKTEQKYKTQTKIKDNLTLKKNGEIKEQINYLFKKGRGFTTSGKKQLKINEKITGERQRISVTPVEEKNKQKEENKGMSNKTLKTNEMKINALNEFNETCIKIMAYSHMAKKETKMTW